MSLVKVFFNPLDGSDRKEYQVEPGTQIIEFLQEHFPSGFNGHLRVFAGVEEIQIDDLDRVIGEEELITLLVMPAGGAFIAAALPYVIQALVAVAIGFVLNLIFKPSAPNAAKEEAESPVYSLNASRNAARLGDPITCHYGTVSFPPDFAAAPYIFYYEGSNDMYVDELLCLGHGQFDVQQVYIGDTPVTSIEPGSVRYWTFTPLQHMQTMGNISNRVANWLRGSENPWPFRENVFTSPEVENFEFNNDRSEEVSAPTGFAGRAFATAYDPVSQSTVLGHISEVDASLDIRVGDTMTLANTVSNNGSFRIGSVVVDPDNSALVTLFQSYDSSTSFADEDPLPGGTTYVLNTAVDDTVGGPFRAQKQGQQVNAIDCDIIFPQGLYRVDGTSGAIKTHTVTMRFSYQEIDDDGTPIGAPTTQDKTYTSKSRSPLRSTVTSGVLPAGAYEVTVERVTPIEDDSRKHGIVSWAGLKGMVVNSPDPVYQNTTIMAIRMRATNGLASAARSRIRVTAKRILDSGNSDNPITAIKDVWTSTDYGLGRPTTELDLDVLDALEADWEEVDGPSFNGSFDKRGTGFDAMQSIASMTGSKIVQTGGLTTVVLDRQQPVRTALFSSGNIVPGSMEILYSFDTTDDYDGIQIEYRNPDTFQVEYVTHPPSAQLPDTFVLFGCTDATYAQQYARYLHNVRRIRRKQVKFQTELEGLIPRFGDRIAVAHPMPQWGTSGVIVEVIDETTFRVDQYLNWVSDRVMILRSDMGQPSSQYEVTRGSADDIVVFPEVPDVTVNDAQSKEPTSYTFGKDGLILKDFILTKVTPKGDTAIEIEGQTYTANIFTGAPPHMGV